jgi:hypothetical protein
MNENDKNPYGQIIQQKTGMVNGDIWNLDASEFHNPRIVCDEVTGVMYELSIDEYNKRLKGESAININEKEGEKKNNNTKPQPKLQQKSQPKPQPKPQPKIIKKQYYEDDDEYDEYDDYDDTYDSMYDKYGK